MSQPIRQFHRPIYLLLLLVFVFVSCSTTKNIPEGDQLFVGLTDIKYETSDDSEHFITTQEEVDAALATAPNGALFGSSFYRTPFPYGLWIWNAFSGSDSKFSKWMTSSFGKAPVLMSWVNPELRASVAQSVLRNHGYFNASVTHEVVPQKNPRKSKIGYTVNTGRLYMVDTLQYAGFPAVADSLISASLPDAKVRKGVPFDASLLEAERTRVSNLLRDNGYFYYQSAYASYLADTLAVPGSAQLRLQMAGNVPDKAKRKWYIGNININFMRQRMEQLTDSFSHRYFTVRFNGRRPPIRPRVLLRDLKLRPRQEYSYSKYMESANKINSTGIFSSVQFGFTPRDTTSLCDTLDLSLSCIFDNPYDFYVETNYKAKVSGRMGPELVLGLTKKNAFRGGEILDISLHGSYEWQTGNSMAETSSGVNSYEYGADVSVEFPRLIVPFLKRRRYFTTPSTIAKASMNVINRPDYFKMHTASGEWSYRWQTSERSRHEFSPLTLNYQYLNYTTHRFDSILSANPYLYATMQDVFIPKMQYTYTYSNAHSSRNPLLWTATLTEAGNMVALGYMAAGKKWSEKNKTMFENAFAQFLKFETSISKTWMLGLKSHLVAHLSGGVIYTFGNSDVAPYVEQFYVGGANSVRAFTVRSIGPGSYAPEHSRLSYLDQTGDIKLQANLEYRFPLFGDLHGAAFLDAGNVWTLRDDGYRTGSKFQAKNIIKEMALGTGVGIRYDLDFLILRLDWGVGLHVPYETGKSGFYNIPKFSDSHSLHLAVGYPF